MTDKNQQAANQIATLKIIIRSIMDKILSMEK
jgi:hypothetical protein